VEVTNNSLRSLYSHSHSSTTFRCHYKCRRRSCITPQSLSLTSILLSRYILFDVVGRRQRFPIVLPHSSRQKFADFCFMRDFYLFYSVFPKLTPPSCKNTYLSSCSFVYLFGVLGGHHTQDGRTILVAPTHRIARFPTVHTLFVHFFPQFSVPFVLWLATFVSIVLQLEFCCTSSHCTYAILPHPFPSHPSLCLLIRIAGVFLGFGRSDNGSWTWLVPSLGQSPRCPSSTADERCALCPYHSRLCSAYLVDRWSSTQSHPSANW
jgi:hypothetical protein